MYNRQALPLLLPRALVPWLWSLLLDPTQWHLILASVSLLGQTLHSWWLPLLRRRCPRPRKQLPRRWRDSCWRWSPCWRRWFHQQGLWVFLEIRSTPGHSGQGKKGVLNSSALLTIYLVWTVAVATLNCNLCSCININRVENYNANKWKNNRVQSHSSNIIIARVEAPRGRYWNILFLPLQK